MVICIIATVNTLSQVVHITLQKIESNIFFLNLIAHDWLISLEIMCKLHQINNTPYNVGFTKLLRYKKEMDITDETV